MELKMTKIPFDIELAKQITSGEIKGRVVTLEHLSARIVCWDARGDLPIVALINGDDEEYSCKYTEKGLVVDGYPSSDDLMLEVPEYITFKDGDIISGYDYILVCKEPKWEWGFFCLDGYVGIHSTTGGKLYDDLKFENQKLFRFATEEEKGKLMKALEESVNVKHKAILKEFFKEKKQRKGEFTFKQPVLVRSYSQYPWMPAEFGYRGPSGYVVIGGNIFEECIPYNEETKHLMGTTDKWEE